MPKKIKYVLSPTNQTRKAPVNFTCIVIIMLKVFGATGVIIGAMAVIILVLWYFFFKDLFEHTQQYVDIFSNLPKTKPHADRNLNVRGQEISEASE